MPVQDAYSIIESAKLNKLNVSRYLTHLLTELPRLGTELTNEQFDALMPGRKYFLNIVNNFCS